MVTDATNPAQPRPAIRRTARPVSALAAVALVGLLAAACGSSTPNASGTSNSSTTAASPAGTTGTTGATGATGAAGQVVATTVSNTKIGGSILVDSSGMTLYRFSADSAGKSACNGTCATAWPPLTVPSGTTPKGGSGAGGTFATITRSDGSTQVTYDDDPLYTFSGDSSAGDTNGQGIKSDGGTWTVVTVGSSTPPMTTAPPTTKAPSGGYGY